MAKKHKKKVYTTPKKIKSVHKNIPLNILKSINNPRCENCGSVMAVHENRHTCSKCGIHIYK